MMEINRRRFLASGAMFGSAKIAGSVSLIGTSLLTTSQTSDAAVSKARAERSSLFASAYTDKHDNNFVAIIDQEGLFRASMSVPSRGHSACFSPDGKRVAFFARRPGRWLKVLNLSSGAVEASVVAAKGRHFFGHGVYSLDSRYLYTTENDFVSISDNARGVIGVYDTTQNYRRVDELDSGGIGPHELALLSDGRTLVIANGGIETHPDFGRRKLNLDSMKPSLSYVDTVSKAIVEQVDPPHFQLSLRHLDVDKYDNVVVGAQYQGDPRHQRPLVFHHQRGKGLKSLAKQPVQSLRSLNQYIASVTFSSNGDYVLTSAPRGDRVSIWNTRDWKWLGDISVEDVGGIAPVSGSSNMLLTSGSGAVLEWLPPKVDLRKVNQVDLHWDNHIRSI